MKEIIPRKKEAEEVRMMAPLVWAYIGDSVYELFIRTYFVNNTKLNPNKLHIEGIKYVKAASQANILKRIYEDLTDEEKDIVRRGRNAKTHHLPKNANVEEYMYATAFEALIGYLYLMKKDERLGEILSFCIEENK